MRTGYERMIAHRVDPMYAVTAKKPGEVTEVTDSSITVSYEDGTVVGYELGTQFGSSAGSVYPHRLVTTLTVGQKVEEGDVVAYNKGFFKPSTLNPKRVDWMAGVLTKVAVREASYTVEDSSALSVELCRRLASETVKVKTIKVNFDQQVRSLVQPGDRVDLETILCTIEDAVTADSRLFDEQSLNTLRLLSAMTPRAKAVGVVEKVEVFYNGDVDDMSESLAHVAAISDRTRKRQARRLGKEVVTGFVDRSMRIDGDGLELDQAAIRVYITTGVPMGIGDKLVLANQMKSVVGEILIGTHETESGMPYDMVFGAKSIMDRIVLSPVVIGTTNTLLRAIGETAARRYFEDRS